MQLYIYPNSIVYLFSIFRSSVFERCRSFWKSSVYQRCVRHVTRSRTRFSREFRARGGDQGTLGLGYHRIDNQDRDKHCALSAIGVDERARITRAFNACTTGQIEIKPAIFPHSMNNRARRKCQVRSVRCFTSNEMFVVYNTLVWFVFDIFKCSISDIWYNARINVAGNVLMRILDAVRFCFIGYESMNASNIYYIKRISNYSFKIEVKIHILIQ